MTPVVTAAASAEGWATYVLSADLNGDARSLYSIFGRASSPLSLPPAFQVDAPFGTDISGIADALVAAEPTAAYDSWLTIGATDGSLGTDISSIGIDFDSWTESNALVSTDGSVFMMDPNSGPSGTVVLGQVTVPSNNIAGTVSFGVQGRSTD